MLAWFPGGWLTQARRWTTSTPPIKTRQPEKPALGKCARTFATRTPVPACGCACIQANSLPPVLWLALMVLTRLFTSPLKTHIIARLMNYVNNNNKPAGNPRRVYFLPASSLLRGAAVYFAGPLANRLTGPQNAEFITLMC